MADYSKEFERMKFSYIFNTNMASIDPDDVDEYPVFEMSDTVLSPCLQTLLRMIGNGCFAARSICSRPDGATTTPCAACGKKGTAPKSPW